MNQKIGSFEELKNTNKKLIMRLNNWKIKADEFYRASEYLWIQIINDDKDAISNKRNIGGYYIPLLHKPYFLLISLSIENLLKGLVLFENPELISEKLNNSIKTHNLSSISKLTNSLYSEEEINFFELASIIIEWYSRYPIPTNSKKVIQTANFNYNKIRITYINLFFKLSSALKKTGGLTNDYNYIFQSSI